MHYYDASDEVRSLSLSLLYSTLLVKHQLTVMQVTSIVSTFPMLPRGHARRSPHDRHTVVCRYLSLLCGIHHIASPGQRLHCQRPTSHSVAMLYARLVRRHHCMPAMTSPWSFCLCRFLVGLTEGPFLPAVSLMTSSWYTKHESPLRMGIWHAGNIISNVISGLLAAAILTNMDNVAGMHAWQWFLLLEGMCFSRA